MFKDRFYVLMNEAGGDGGAAGSGTNTGGAGGEGNTGGAGGQGGDSGMTADGGLKMNLFTSNTPEPKAVDLKEVLGEELAANKTFEKFSKSENFTQDLAKSYAELEKMVGKPGVGVPGEDATDEQKASFYKAMGVPDEPAGYEFKRPDNIPEDQYDQAHADKWAQIFKENNIPASAANALREQFMNEVAEQLGEFNKNSEEATKKLDESYTKAFGDKKLEVTQAVKATLEKAIPDVETRKALQEKMPDEALLAIGMLDQYYKKTYGMSDTNHGDGGNASGQSMDGLRQEAQKLMSSDAYRDRMHRDHKSTVDKVNSLYKDLGELTRAQRK